MKILATSLFILLVLLFGMLFGVYQATQIIETERKTEQAVAVAEKPPVEEKKLEQERKKLPKEEMTLLERQAWAKEVQAMNVYSELGEAIGEGVEHVFKQLITTATTEMNDLINKQ